VTAALIVIEIAAPQASDDALSVLVSACTRAAREAECVLAKDASDEQPAAVAIVSLQAEDKMRVEVGVHQGDHDSWRTKDFSFLAADEPLDRWRAIGFAIGTLAESEPPPEVPAARSPAPPVAARAPVVPKPPAAQTPKPKPRSIGPLSVGAAAIFGPGLDSGGGPWRLGSELYADLALPGVPMFVTFGGSAATRVRSDVSNSTARWFDVSLGAGVPLLGSPSRSGLELRTAALAEYFDVAASTFGRSDTMNRWTFGVEGALGGRVRLVPDLFLTAEAQAAGFSGSTDVHVAGRLVGTNASFRYLGSVGLRVLLR
jgi:hypothetical protein